jgi:spermidine/putrescine transport system substrate-binding protein
MFLESRDTFGLVLASMGIREPDATVEDVERAQQILLEHRDNFRGFYGNDYLDAFALGDLAVTMAWSGDVFAVQLDDPDLRFVLPDEGGMRWTDNMCIPAGAEHPTDAHVFMNYVYDPQIATNITEWVWYESPVEPVHDMVIEDAQGGPDYIKELAESPLVWPDEETLAQTIPYKRLDEEEEAIWNDLFQQVIQG